MYTQSIVLEEVTLEEFCRMEAFWNIRRKKYSNDVYSKIINPIQETDYEKLFFYLLKHEYANELCVNNGGTWMKRYKNRISDSEIKMMVEIASNNPYKKNYLEIKLQRELGRADRAIIEFTEFNDLIIGYEVRVPFSLKDLFCISLLKNRSFQYNNGLWVPEGY